MPRSSACHAHDSSTEVAYRGGGVIDSRLKLKQSQRDAEKFRLVSAALENHKGRLTKLHSSLNIWLRSHTSIAPPDGLSRSVDILKHKKISNRSSLICLFVWVFFCNRSSALVSLMLWRRECVRLTVSLRQHPQRPQLLPQVAHNENKGTTRWLITGTLQFNKEKDVFVTKIICPLFPHRVPVSRNNKGNKTQHWSTGCHANSHWFILYFAPSLPKSLWSTAQV